MYVGAFCHVLNNEYCIVLDVLGSHAGNARNVAYRREADRPAITLSLYVSTAKLAPSLC